MIPRVALARWFVSCFVVLCAPLFTAAARDAEQTSDANENNPAPGLVDSSAVTADENRPPEPTFEGDQKLQVPVQLPLPAPPIVPAGPPALWQDRATRPFDIGFSLAELIARDGGFALGRTFGGAAPAFELRGSSAGTAGDLRITLDDIPMSVPLSARGIDHVNLNLVPITGLGAYTMDKGPFGRGYTGEINLSTADSVGVRANVFMAQHLRRGFALRAGQDFQRTHASITLEGHQVPHASTDDDRLTVLARSQTKLGENTTVTARARHYRQSWSGHSALSPASDGVADGGNLQGLEGALQLRWTPSATSSLSTHLAILDDRFQDFASHAGGQSERVEQHQVVRAGAEVVHIPATAIPLRLGLHTAGTFTRGSNQWHETAARQRTALTQQHVGDLFDANVTASMEAEPHHRIAVRGHVGARHVAFRRDADRLAPLSRTAANGALTMEARATRNLSLAVQAGRQQRLNPLLWTSNTPLISHDSISLSAFGGLSQWRHGSLQWQLHSFFSLYNTHFPQSSSYEAMVSGWDIDLDFFESKYGFAASFHGGPRYSLAQGNSGFAVPAYVGHLGLLRRGQGLSFAVWFDVLGTPWDDGAKAIFDVSPRLGYQWKAFTLWGGVHQALNAAPALGEQAWLFTANPATPAFGRYAYLLLDVDTQWR